MNGLLSFKQIHPKSEDNWPPVHELCNAAGRAAKADVFISCMLTNLRVFRKSHLRGGQMGILNEENSRMPSFDSHQNANFELHHEADRQERFIILKTS